MRASTSSRGQRLALLHFTLPPSIGGIERMIAAQSQVLRAAGYEVRVIAGRGDALPGTDTHILPSLDPSHPEVRRNLVHLCCVMPPPHHPLVLKLMEELEAALEGCDQCW